MCRIKQKQNQRTTQYLNNISKIKRETFIGVTIKPVTAELKLIKPQIQNYNFIGFF